MDDIIKEPNYWPSVIIGALLIAIVIFVVSLFSSYMVINTAPSGELFGPAQVIGSVSCLLGIFGGFAAVVHYAKTNNVSFTVGRGALIGLLTGLVAAVFVALLNELWQLIDPSYARNFIDASIANLEAMSIPDEQKKQLIEATAEKLEKQFNTVNGVLLGTGISMITFGILNLLSGMVGAKIFGKSDTLFPEVNA